MKKIVLIVAFFATLLVQKSLAQDSTSQAQLSQLFTSYYAIKDALVADNAATASAKAEQLVKTLNSIDYKVISEGNINALLKDATSISESGDVKQQRERFARLSDNMSALAKNLKLSDQPVHQAYCPMKKAYWLSSEKTIKNPYYGNSMLTCGKVVETFQQ